MDQGGVTSLRRRVPPSDTGRRAGARSSHLSCKQRGPREATSASGSRLDSGFHHPGQPCSSVSVTPLQKCLQPGSLIRGTTPSNASSTPSSGSASPRGWDLVPGLGEIGAGVGPPQGLPCQISRPRFNTGPGRPTGIAAVSEEPVRKVTPHVFAFRAVVHHPPRFGETKLPRLLPQAGAVGRGPAWVGGSLVSLAPELLNVTSLLLCF